MSESNPRRVLLVDDDPALSRLVQMRLERVGYLVDRAANGEEGLIASRTGRYDAILVDQDLPDRSGLDVVRGMLTQNNVPTIMVTGTGNEQLAAEAFRLGLGDYLIKDAQGKFLDQLPQVIDRLLDEHDREVDDRRPHAMLRHSQSLLVALYDHSPSALILFDEDKIYDCNHAALKYFGCDTIEEMLQRHLLAFGPSVQSDGRDSAALIAEMLHVARRDVQCEFEFVFQRLDGTTFVGAVTLIAVDVAGRQLVHALVRDITERKRSEERQRMHAARLTALLSLAQMTESPLQEIMNRTLEEAVRLTGSDIGYLALLNEDESSLTMHSWSKNAMSQCNIIDKPIIYPLDKTGLWGETVRQRKPVFTNDYAGESRWKRGVPVGHVNIVRHLGVPLFEGKRIVAVIGVGNKPSDYDETDAAQVNLLLEGMWLHVQRQRGAEESRAHQDHLERLVDDRTAELTEINAHMQQSNAELQRRSEELADRVKELDCLHALGAILQDSEKSEEEIIRDLVEAIIQGWHYPDTARARIILDDQVYASDGFQETVWRLSSPIILANRLAGSLDVCYPEDHVPSSEQPFRKNERSLLDDAAGLLGTAIARRRADAEVRLLTRQIEFILGASKTGLSIVDDDLRLLYVDRQRQQVYGPPEGRLCFEYFLDRNAPCEECGLTKAISSRQIVIREDKVAREGNRPVQVTSIPFQNDAGRWLVAEVSVDISERKRMEGELAQSQRLEAIGQLAAGIAHEINTPVQFIGDNLRFLQDAIATLSSVALAGPSGHDDSTDTELAYLLEEAPKAIEQSIHGAGQVANIVRAMKEFSHPHTRQKQAVDLNRIIQNTVTISRNEWKYVADVETDLDPQLPLVSCLPGEISQVILNLVVNAAHAITKAIEEHHRPRGVIRIRTRKESGFACIDVEDDGTGIPVDIRHRIFDPFFTTKAVGKGTGQGLTIAHSVVVKVHGGSISFHSDEGHGTVFTVKLPFHPPQDPPAEPTVDAIGRIGHQSV